LKWDIADFLAPFWATHETLNRRTLRLRLFRIFSVFVAGIPLSGRLRSHPDAGKGHGLFDGSDRLLIGFGGFSMRINLKRILKEGK